jgi:hypothetical protein
MVRGAPLVGTLPSMAPPATERTTQLPPASVARMRQEANPAVDAVNNALLKMRAGLQNRVQHRLILTDNWPGAIALVPIRITRETFFDGDGKKAKFSAILVTLRTSLSYLIDAKASRGRARIFVRSGREVAASARATTSSPIDDPDRSACAIGAHSLSLIP